MVDWDKWRRDYPHLTWQQQLKWYATIEQHCPQQLHYDREAASRFVAAYRPARVLEIGGWKGEMALDLLEVYPTIQEWLNIEVITKATRYATDRYHVLIPDDYIWKVGLPTGYDVLIMSHSLEHMTPENLTEVIEQFDGRAIYTDSPLLRPGETWDGYVGTHIFDGTYDTVDDICEAAGFRPVYGQLSERHAESQITWYQR